MDTNTEYKSTAPQVREQMEQLRVIVNDLKEAVNMVETSLISILKENDLVGNNSPSSVRPTLVPLASEIRDLSKELMDLNYALRLIANSRCQL